MIGTLAYVLPWVIGAIFVLLIITGRIQTGARRRIAARPQWDGLSMSHVEMPKALQASNAPPLPAWARYEPESLEPAVLTHEAAWEARETLRRLDPETAADLDRTVPLEPPPPPPALSVQVETVKEHAGRVTGEHRHPLRARLAEIVRDLERLMSSAVMGDGHFHLTQAQADAYKALVSEGETLRIALDHEQQAADWARKMAAEERAREERAEETKARHAQAMANLVELRRIQADLQATNARIGNSPERATSMRRIITAIANIERDMSEADRTTAYALAIAHVERSILAAHTVPAAQYREQPGLPDIEQVVRAEALPVPRWEPGEVVVYQEGSSWPRHGEVPYDEYVETRGWER